MNLKYNIIKNLEFENDDLLLKFFNIKINKKNIEKVFKSNKYLYEKFKKFKNKDFTKVGLYKFKNRNSLRNISNVKNLKGTIYTYSIQFKNELLYEDILEKIKERLKENKNTRKLIIRVADSFLDYFKSDKYKNIDVSCLNLIHYYNNNIKFIFRALDIKNEFFFDFLLLYYFFIYPIYRKKFVNITFYASTVQNIKYLDIILNKIINI